MAKRRSIEIDGFKHSNPIPGASVVGNLMMSSIIAGRDPKTGKLPETLDGQLACLFAHVRAFVERGIDDGKTVKRWSETTVRRVSAYLTGCCADYGMLERGLRSSHATEVRQSS